jgi:hypothetical protein
MAAERPRKPFTGLKPGSGAKRQAAAPSEVPDDAASGRAQQQQQQEQIADLTDAENRLLEGLEQQDLRETGKAHVRELADRAQMPFDRVEEIWRLARRPQLQALPDGVTRAAKLDAVLSVVCAAQYGLTREEVRAAVDKELCREKDVNSFLAQLVRERRLERFRCNDSQPWVYRKLLQREQEQQRCKRQQR